MRHSRAFHNRLCLLTYALLLSVVTLSGAQNERNGQDLRIGLQTKQSSVHLQGTVPLLMQAVGVTPVELPAEEALTFTKRDHEIVVTDSSGAELLVTQGTVKIRPNPTPPETRMRDPENPPLPPLIRLLGPGKHYDKKVDRPYRGYFEVLPQTDGLTVVNIINVEPYLWGVVSSEMSPGYPAEALKAQAVAARTYALKNIGRFANQGFDLDDTARCQVYGGYFSEDPRTTEVVNATAGMVLTYEGKLIDAVYSSTCGGITESAEEAWGRAVPYLVSVPDFPADINGGAPTPKTEQQWAEFFKLSRDMNCLQPRYARPEAFRWIKISTRKELEAGLPETCRVGAIQNIVPLQRGSSGRITKLRIDGSERSVTIESELTIRKALGGLNSSAFTVESYPDDNGAPLVFAFWGGGWGHGIGMCQVGAVGLADQGWTYDKILAHYYRGAMLEKR